jgi:hypothetical protein
MVLQTASRMQAFNRPTIGSTVHKPLNLHLYDLWDDQWNWRPRSHGESDWSGDRYGDCRCVRSLYLLLDSEWLVHGHSKQDSLHVYPFE